MVSATMGKVLVSAVVENLDDLFAVGKGLLPADRVRRVEVSAAHLDLVGIGDQASRAILNVSV